MTTGLRRDQMRGFEIRAGEIGSDELAPNSVTSTHIATGAVGSDEIAANAVGSDEIAADSVGLSELVAAVEEALVPTGSIVAYGGTAAPTGWRLCNGDSLLRADFAALFAVIGTAFGAVDGTHFNVPDLRQRVPLGQATSGTGSTLGGTGGTIDHVHALNTSSSHAKLTAAAGSGPDNLRLLRKSTASWDPTLDGDVTSIASATSGAQNTGLELGGSSDVGNQAFQAVNFLVKT